MTSNYTKHSPLLEIYSRISSFIDFFSIFFSRKIHHLNYQFTYFTVADAAVYCWTIYILKSISRSSTAWEQRTQTISTTFKSKSNPSIYFSYVNYCIRKVCTLFNELQQNIDTYKRAVKYDVLGSHKLN